MSDGSMTGRERVLATLSFSNADRIPLDLWVLPAAQLRYGDRLNALMRRHETDFGGASGPFDQGNTPEYYRVGKYVDPWGSEWLNLQEGVIGEVKKPVFADSSAMDGYVPPIERFLREFRSARPSIAAKLQSARAQHKFINGGWISLFERLQFLRGTEALYCDLALDEPELYRMMDMVMEFMHAYLGEWLEMDVDSIVFGDDWGSQRAMLIAPALWRRVFKPRYRELIDRIKASGKKVFFHSDGYIFDIYGDLIDLGVDAVNSQLWCMGVDKVAREFAGKITFWGEISRQTILPQGAPEDVIHAARTMIEKLHMGGGLIAQSEVNKDVPFENIEAFFRAWRT